MRLVENYRDIYIQPVSNLNLFLYYNAATRSPTAAAGAITKHVSFNDAASEAEVVVSGVAVPVPSLLAAAVLASVSVAVASLPVTVAVAITASTWLQLSYASIVLTSAVADGHFLRMSLIVARCALCQLYQAGRKFV